ncbi:MAG: sugar ABC transporter ATP-binding protein [Lachnospiraceae bacterium]|nr:sugar ABC transporter ATP-binding protein [Lachnospiraceae bacterium]
MAEKTLLLKMEHIHKKFPGVYALNDAKLELMAGEVHALLGENGAGKSTLIKILGGIYEKNQGEIYIDGTLKEINSVEDARSQGISIIHQELVLVPFLSIAENIFLGREPKKKSGLINRSKMIADTKNALDDFGLNLNPNSMIADLNIAQQQMVEIVKAISFNAKIIVMDEPTSSLSDTEVEGLFKSVKKLTARGIGIIYISHRMSELGQIADRVTVMRDGQYVDTKVIKETNNDELIRLMVGRELTSYYTRDFNASNEIVMEVKDLCSEKSNHVNFELRKGEILGFAGLIGAGRSETMEAIFGLKKITSGKVILNGMEIQGLTTKEVMKKGIGLVPEDRRAEGIFPDMATKFNITLKALDEFIKGIHVDGTKEHEISSKYINELAVKVPTDQTPIRSLSGGNQQKAILGSWLATNPTVLILDEPTRGVDVGAKSEIYMIMNELAKKGVSIIMVSSDLPEVLNMSDRVAVMSNGSVTGILDHMEATQTNIMEKAVQY